MTNKQIILSLIILILFCNFTFKTGYEIGIEKQEKINVQLKEELNKLKQNYDILEAQYKKDLESCYTQLGDLQDRYELGDL